MSKKLLLYSFAIIVVAWGGYKVCLPYFSIGGKYDINYSGEDLKEHFKKKEKEIFELKYYYENLIPKSQVIRFGFDDRVDRFHLSISSYDTTSMQPIYPVQGWSNLKLNSSEMDSLLLILNWSKNDIQILIKKLKLADCIGIKSAEPFPRKPFSVFYRHGGFIGMSLYSYLLFSEPLIEDLANYYNNREGHSVYKDNVIFVYGDPL